MPPIGERSSLLGLAVAFCPFGPPPEGEARCRRGQPSSRRWSGRRRDERGRVFLKTLFGAQGGKREGEIEEEGGGMCVNCPLHDTIVSPCLLGFEPSQNKLEGHIEGLSRLPCSPDRVLTRVSLHMDTLPSCDIVMLDERVGPTVRERPETTITVHHVGSPHIDSRRRTFR